ncbi:MAG: PEP/pyruvate-binding domain-containing protein [Candidatus Saccharibacteria bacterium]|nr:PEP/pyruvate-binding domain-containing protein [Candidatus Saccharibacteria bacterium]
MNNGVINLSEISEEDFSLVGGKALNLAKLIQGGLPVPEGFVVSLSAFDSENKLKNEFEKQVQELISEDKLYAVRSSALAEDAEGASWAGQFETFLNTKSTDVLAKIEECHNTAKNRAKAYADNQMMKGNFQVAVVVQEMIQPEFAGVLFTKDPVTGADQLITEYIEGLGEELVVGRSDPERVVLGSGEKTPFDSVQLAELAQKVEKLFGNPQDIEWCWANNKIWLVQARPITATGKVRQGMNLGESSELFYWGPSRAKPMYMSDFMSAIDRIFKQMTEDSDLPNPPKTLVLFDEGKMVWLSNAQEFADFTEKTFEAYEKRDQLEQDIEKWTNCTAELEQLDGQEFVDKLIDAWFYTEFAEFSLYGAETTLIKRLSRFDVDKRQKIWSIFTIPDKPTFLNRIDIELASSMNPKELAEKYSWIEDGYDGLSGTAENYFINRLKVVSDGVTEVVGSESDRVKFAEVFVLTNEEISSLNLARKLAEFMDDRKAWMMKTRRSLKQSIGKIENGWFFDGQKAILLNQENTHELWQRYVDFKASASAVVGVVACNGNKHFINGEVVVVNSPNDAVEDGKIVVVPSTSPSYVPLMRKAKALITDHGGMMSHAAIVAREFNLPCIVGTKQATKVLKNGDQVVLDLVTGEVSK